MRYLNADRKSYAEFISSCSRGGADFALTSQADASAYARCFGIFNRVLMQSGPLQTKIYAEAMRSELRGLRASAVSDIKSKSYRQLLAFTLSALAAIDELRADPLGDLVEEQLSGDIGIELRELGCLAGRPGSGNQAMFLAIFHLHARDWLGMNTQSRIEDWVGLHLERMNRYGFWSASRGMTHLQFQNGYHQHEILEYLGVENPREDAMVRAVSSLADREGRFAPYPGGGGCYDYDAVFLLTPGGRIPDDDTRALLQRTADSIVSAQNPDGGFCESQYVRPRSPANMARFVRHIASAWKQPAAMKERLRYGMTLQRMKHGRIHTHWSRYSRRWNESDLWDSWFRMLALARIEVAMDPSKASGWGFIDYPGIGFHPSLRASSVGK